ncbi:MAG: T9SS type A sorting domain-containing protein [Bacteroidota bacterium]
MKKTIFLLTAFITTLVSAQEVTTFAGSTQGYTDGAGSAAQFHLPYGVATDAAGNVYVGDQNNHKIRKITPTGVVTTFAGSTQGSDDGIVTVAKFNNPHGVATDAAGNVYVADLLNHRIRKITPSGVVSTFAGSSQGYADGPGASARFYSPTGVATDGSGNVYVADYNNNKIRKITSAGVVSTLAGSIYGFAEGTGASAQFRNPTGVATDALGNVYVADYYNDRIRKITPAGVVTTLAGSGPALGSSDGIGEAAKFYRPIALTTDETGNVYVSDTLGQKIRKVTPTGVVTTLAGNGSSGSTDGPGTTAKFNHPIGIATDAAGNIYIADATNHRIRKITQQLGVGQNELGPKIAIYPNPVTAKLTIQLENGGVLDKITITNLSGKIIGTQIQNTAIVNVENLAQGIYILEVYSGEDKYVSKFVKE